MVMPMRQLPISYEQLRSLMLEALGRLEQSTQLDGLNKVVGKLACEKNLVPDPNGPDPSRHAMYFLDQQDVARAQDIFWDLIIEGVIRPGLGQGSGNSDLPYFHVTDYGKEQVRHGTGSPHDPDGYLSRLRADLTALDPVIMTYMNECLRTFRIGCLLSSAVMLGCASEKALLLLLDAYAIALPPAKETKFRKKIEGKFIKTQYEEFIKMLQGHLRAQLPHELDDGLANILLGVFEMIRAERNDAGHPTGQIPSRELAFANISVFPGYLKRIYDLMAWLQCKSPGRLS
jgi:hypothetical protein